MAELEKVVGSLSELQSHLQLLLAHRFESIMFEEIGNCLPESRFSSETNNGKRKGKRGGGKSYVSTYQASLMRLLQASKHSMFRVSNTLLKQPMQKSQVA
jgi:hypothetical protein